MRRVIALTLLSFLFVPTHSSAQKGRFEKKFYEGSKYFADFTLAGDTGTTVYRMARTYRREMVGYDGNNVPHSVTVQLAGISETGDFRFMGKSNAAGVVGAMIVYGVGRHFLLRWAEKKGKWPRRIATGFLIGGGIVNLRAGMGNIRPGPAAFSHTLWVQYGLVPKPYANPVPLPH